MGIRRFCMTLFMAILMLVTTAMLTGCQSAAPATSSGTSGTTAGDQSVDLADLHGYVRTDEETLFVAVVTDRDEEAIIMQLYPDKAPVTVANFQKLVGKGFYNGLTFHRVVDSYLIQGGDPSGNGTGGPGYTIKGEFTSNGVENDLSHVRGTVSMARTDKPDTAGSQFFICQKALDSLDGDYAAFGKVIEGMSVVDRIAAVPNSGSPNNRPTESQVMKEVFFVNSDNAG